TRTSSTRCVTPSWPPTGSKTFGGRRDLARGRSHSLLPILAGATVMATGELLDDIVPFQRCTTCRVPAGSERFRIAQRNCGSLRARLRVRETHRTGWGETHVGPETARVHHAARRRGCRVAARGARAAADDNSQSRIVAFGCIYGCEYARCAI